MKAITIWQPWADLIVLGYKQIETRSWPGYCTGPIAIHAAKFRKLPHEVYESIAQAIGITPENYKGSWLDLLEQGEPAERFGAILGTADLQQAMPTTLTIASPMEQALGNFLPGRYAWPLKNVTALRTPIPYKEKQGIWEIPAPPFGPMIIMDEVGPAPGPEVLRRIAQRDKQTDSPAGASE